MPTQGRPVEPSAFRELQRRIERLENEIARTTGRRLMTADRITTDSHPAPSEGQISIGFPGNSFRFYADQRWRGGEKFELKVFSDSTTVSTGDGKFYMACDDDMDGMSLIDADAFVSTVSSSGTPTIQIRNVTDSVDMLSTRITIDASEYTSYTAATPPVINTANSTVSTGDLLAIDVDVAGTGAKGLGVMLQFA